MFYLTFTKGELPLKEFSVNHTDPDMRKDFIKPGAENLRRCGVPALTVSGAQSCKARWPQASQLCAT